MHNIASDLEEDEDADGFIARTQDQIEAEDGDFKVDDKKPKTKQNSSQPKP
jgi:hypothetical protein